MPKFEIRYVTEGLEDAPEPVVVEAAMFATVGEFTDFFSRSNTSLGGASMPSGDVVFRVRNDLVADIRIAPQSDGAGSSTGRA